LVKKYVRESCYGTVEEKKKHLGGKRELVQEGGGVFSLIIGNCGQPFWGV